MAHFERSVERERAIQNMRLISKSTAHKSAILNALEHIRAIREMELPR